MSKPVFRIFRRKDKKCFKLYGALWIKLANSTVLNTINRINWLILGKKKRFHVTISQMESL